MNYSYDWDGELEKQYYESPASTAYRHWQESNERRAKECLNPIDWEDSIQKKELEEDEW
jgi:hypothetical protein